MCNVYYDGTKSVKYYFLWIFNLKKINVKDTVRIGHEIFVDFAIWLFLQIIATSVNNDLILMYNI